MPRARITISLSPDLLAAVDSYIRGHPGLSRSAVCTKAITAWLQADQETLIERYYNDQSPSDRQEDDQWRRLASRSAAAAWD